ncbi:MAG: RNA polymerase sigma factor FliA [Halothiobacillaceae bacterium]|jgi:RNA polymerase sigma factor for flagellar operon FliA|nr:RNA polymerase sigma factor FliA [Halothiobacillaceae bacterium]MDY0049450.1 RNA polymerase sigma factor FliA [Halothiobacillaceae bacterium]
MYLAVQQGEGGDLLTRHAGLVKRIAYHLAARLPESVQVDDLVQAGMVGLLEAARHFDAAQGASFETYAGIRIRGAMLDELRRNDWAPRSVHRRWREVSEAVREVEASTGREARDSEVAQRLGMPVEEYHRILADSASAQLFSLDHGGEDNEDLTLDVEDERPGPAELCMDERFRQSLAAAIAALPERERLVMSLYYVDELNQREIGEVLGVTESRVCQIHNKAVLRLRETMAGWR